jgi:conserved hypothetical protein
MLKKWQKDFLKTLNDMLKDTVHQLDYVMPVEWEKIYFHGDVINRFGVFYFYFNTKENKKYSYYNDIPKIYNVSEREYNERIENLYDAFLFLDDLFLEYKRTNWKSITIIVDKKTIETYFDYTDWPNSPFDSKSLVKYFFNYKYLGEMPKTEEQKKLFKEIEKYQKRVVPYSLSRI